MTTDTEALVRRAYHFAEGAVLDVQGFTGLFAEDGVCTGICGPSGPESYRGEHLGDVVVFMGGRHVRAAGRIAGLHPAVAASAPPR